MSVRRPLRRRLARGLLPIVALATVSLHAQDEPLGPAVDPPGVGAPATGPAAEGGATDGPTARTGFTGRPRWEIGVGGGYLESFDYPGSEDPNRRTVALPFAIYRGPVLRLGDGGVRAMAIERPRLQLAFSFGGSLSSSAEADGARAGLPDLDYLFEAGPRLRLVLADRPAATGGRWQANASIAVRGVVSTDLDDDLDGRGTLGEIGLSVAHRRVAGSRVDVFGRVEARFAEDRLHEYYYEVPERFATDARPAYDAGGGYLGAGLQLGLAFRPTPRVRLFLGVSHDRYDGAANEGSPLLETDATTAAALGFAWTVLQSRARVEVVDVE